MRMWMLPPECLCNKHLLGEHGEIHKHRHVFVQGHSIANRIKYPAQIVPLQMESRHKELAREMWKRGMEHKSSYSLPDLMGKYNPLQLAAIVNIKFNIEDLSSRCSECQDRIIKYFKFNQNQKESLMEKSKKASKSPVSAKKTSTPKKPIPSVKKTSKSSETKVETKVPVKDKSPVEKKETRRYTSVLDLDPKDLLKELIESKDQNRKRDLRRWLRKLGHQGGASEAREKEKAEKMEREIAEFRAKKLNG